MRLLLYTLATLLFSLPVMATENAIDVAQNLAKRYCSNPSLKKTGARPTSVLRSSLEEEPSYFIFSDDATDMFCIVSADGGKVLGYGDNYSDELPPQLQAALDMYAESAHTLPELRDAIVREDIPAFMNVVFSTRSPYNKYIPLREGSGPPVGCVPVALAQICKYYEHPSKLLNDIPPYTHTNATNDTTFYIEGQKAEGRTYDWSLILNHYEKDTTEELNNEIAKLMWDCARSVETSFKQSGSSALTDMFYYSAIHYFGYNSDSIKLIQRKSYYREDWLDIIHEELSKKRPIYMSGTSYQHGGHAFVCDGYVDGYLHINWGWNGSSDGYFDVDIFDYNHNKDKEQTTPDNGYSFFEQMIIGIVPGEGKTKYEKPESANNTERVDDEGINAVTRFRATDNGFKMYTSFKAYKIDPNDEKYYAVGYSDMNGDINYLGEGESRQFYANALTFNYESSFVNSYLGKEIKLYLLVSEKKAIDDYEQSPIANWWSASNLFDPIVVKIPDSIEPNNNIIEPKSINITGEYNLDSSIVLNVELKSERPEGCMRYFALSLVANGDTMMSDDNSHYSDLSESLISLKKSLKNPDLDNEMTIWVMQTDNFSNGPKLKKKDWSVCTNFEPISFKLSDCTIFTKKAKIDTIKHTTKGRKHRFEITFSNPSPFELYNDVYFYLDNESTGLYISIPSGGTTTRIIERELPLLTRYIDDGLFIYNITDTITRFFFPKDTFSHVFYGIADSDEGMTTLQILNATSNVYNNTFSWKNDNDIIVSKDISVDPLTGAEVNVLFPALASDSDIIELEYYKIYSIYDKDNQLLGKVSPFSYYGTISQKIDSVNKQILIDLSPVIDTIMKPVILGFAETLDSDLKSQEKFVYNPKKGKNSISVMFDVNKYCNIKNPRYVGLCREDGTFYAYMKLKSQNMASSPDINANALSIISVDGGILISSDVEIPSLPIYNIEGKLIKRVHISPESSLFVPLNRGIYIVGNKKVECRQL